MSRLGEGGEWLGWRRGTSLFHIIPPGGASLSRDPLYTSFLSTAHRTQLYISSGWARLALPQLCSVRHKAVEENVQQNSIGCLL